MPTLTVADLYARNPRARGKIDRPDDFTLSYVPDLDGYCLHVANPRDYKDWHVPFVQRWYRLYLFRDGVRVVAVQWHRNGYWGTLQLIASPQEDHRKYALMWCQFIDHDIIGETRLVKSLTPREARRWLLESALYIVSPVLAADLLDDENE